MDNQKKPFNQTEYINAFNKEHYDIVRIVLPKGERDKLKVHAKEKGMSLSAWVCQAIRNALDEGL